MKKLILSLGVLALTSAVHAIVMPPVPGGGEVIEDLCGQVTRSTTICTGQTTQSHQNYIVVKTFGAKTSYVPAARTALNPGITGVSRTLYTGRLVLGGDAGPALENNYELTVSQVISPHTPIHGSLKVNGTSVGQGSFAMEPLFHTM